MALQASESSKERIGGNETFAGPRGRFSNGSRNDMLREGRCKRDDNVKVVQANAA